MINKQVKALTFDTGGTILDWHTGFRNGFEKINDNSTPVQAIEIPFLFCLSNEITNP